MGAETPGTLIGSYEVIEHLEGQTSEVYLAKRHGQEAGRQFLVTLFDVRVEDAQRIDEEISRCKRLDHAAIVGVVEVFEHHDKHALVFDSVPGTNLSRLLRHLGGQGERLADRAVYHVGHALFGALNEAHLFKDEDGKIAAIVHGQLGPHMVLVSWRGAVTILGFGMSRVFRLAESLLAESDELRPFMAPEARAGYAPTPRANVYSVAAMLWALFTQQTPPISGDKPESLAKLRPDLPKKVTAAVDQALEPTITQRNITCRELSSVFASLAGSEGRRELRWNMEVFKGLSAVDPGIIPPESLPPSKLSDVPEPLEPPSEKDLLDAGRDAAAKAKTDLLDAGREAAAKAKWESSSGTGAYSIIGSAASRSRKPPPADEGSGDDDSIPLSDSAVVPVSESAVPTPRVVTPRAGSKRPRKRTPAKKTAQKKLGRVTTVPSLRAGGKKRQRQATLLGTGIAALDRDQPAAADDAADKPEPKRGRKFPSLKPPRAGGGSTLRSTKPFMDAPGKPAAEETSKPTAEPTPSPALAVPADRPPAATDDAARGDRSAFDKLAAPLAAAAGSPEPLDLDGGGATAHLPPPAAVPAPDGSPGPGAAGLPPIRDEESSGTDFDDEPTTKFDRTALAGVAVPPPNEFEDYSGEAYELPPVTPSFRPAALAESGFVSPSLRPAAATVGEMADGSYGGDALPLSLRPASPAIAVGSLETEQSAKRPIVSLPVKWTIAVAITAIASFAAGLIVASGPVDVRMAENGEPTSATTAPNPPAGNDATAAPPPTPTRAAPQASSPAATSAPAPSTTTSAEPVASGEDGSELPSYEGYLIVETGGQSDAYVYVAGRPMGPVGKKIRVLCGLINVRLGTNPLRAWYGRGRAVVVACRSVTRFDFYVTAPMAPGAEHGSSKSAPADDKYWIPPSL